MRKKRFGLLIVSAIVIGLFLGNTGNQMVQAAQETDVSVMQSNLTLLGILEESITQKNYSTLIKRKEFASLLVQASDQKDKAEESIHSSLYSDVKASNAYAGAIKLVVEKGLMTGYLDGSFKPNAGVQTKVAAQAALGLLGYSSSDFTGNKTSAQMSKYNLLGLNKGTNKTYNQYLTWEDAIRLVYYLMAAETKEGRVYGETLGYQIDENGDLDYLAVVEDSLSGPILAEGSWEKGLNLNLKKATVYRNQQLSTKESIQEYDVIYYSESTNIIWAYDNKVTGKITAITPNRTSPQAVTVDGVNYTLGTKKAIYDFSTLGSYQLKDTVTLLLGRDGEVAAVRSVVGPIWATGEWQQNLSIELGTATVYRNEKKSSQAAIQEYDVIYYSESMNTVWAYDNKVTGKITAITPNRTNPETVTVNGSAYTLGTQELVDDFSASGKYDLGESVGLFFGMDGEVAQACSIVGPTWAVGEWKKDLPMDLGTATIYRNEKISSQTAIQQQDVIYYSQEMKTVWVYGNKVIGKLTGISPNRTSPEMVTVAGSNYTLGTQELVDAFSASGKYSVEDTIALFFGRDEEVALACQVVGPILAEGGWENTIPVSVRTATIYRNEELSRQDKIQEYDVIYYSQEMDTIWAYDGKVTGKLTGVSPNRTSPETITVAESVYALGSEELKDAFSASGYRLNETVTLFFGMDGEVAIARSASEYSTDVYGVVLRTDSAASTSTAQANVVNYYMVVVDAGGTEHTYYYDSSKMTVTNGTPIYVTYENGEEIITKVVLDKTVLSGNVVDKQGTKLGGRNFASDIRILDVFNGGYVKLYPEDLAGVTLYASKILYFDFNKAGEIATLILDNVSGGSYSYGVVTAVSPNQYNPTSYTYMVDGKKTTVSTDRMYGAGIEGAACAIVTYDTGSIYMTALSGQTVISLTDTTVKTSVWTKSLSSKVAIYYEDEKGNYYQTTLSKIRDLSQYTVTAYYDASLSVTNEVRVLIARNK